MKTIFGIVEGVVVLVATYPRAAIVSAIGVTAGWPVTSAMRGAIAAELLKLGELIAVLS